MVINNVYFTEWNQILLIGRLARCFSNFAFRVCILHYKLFFRMTERLKNFFFSLFTLYQVCICLSVWLGDVATILYINYLHFYNFSGISYHKQNWRKLLYIRIIHKPMDFSIDFFCRFFI